VTTPPPTEAEIEAVKRRSKEADEASHAAWLVYEVCGPWM
jgi:hypothetical protein